VALAPMALLVAHLQVHSPEALMGTSTDSEQAHAAQSLVRCHRLLPSDRPQEIVLLIAQAQSGSKATKSRRKSWN
jgi:hypothetical protein